MSGVISILASFILVAETSSSGNAPPELIAPQFGVAVITKKREVEIRYVESVAVTTDKGTARRMETKPAMVKRDNLSYGVFKDGKELDETARESLLKEPRRVVFVIGRGLDDEYYLDLLKENAIVVFLDESEATTPRQDLGNENVILRGGRGNWWELLSLSQKDASIVSSHRSDIEFDGGRGLAYVAGRSGVVPKGWNSPQLVSEKYEIGWFGGNTGAAQLYFRGGQKEPGRPDTRQSWFLTVADADKNPRVVFTTKANTACSWSISSERTKIFDDKNDQEYYEVHTVGYIRAVGVGNKNLYLKLADGPDLAARMPVTGGHHRYAFGYRPFAVGPKKECLFHYARGWTENN